MSATRIRSRIAASIRAQSTATGAHGGSTHCPQQQHLHGQVLRWLLMAPSTTALQPFKARTRSLLGHSRFTHSSSSPSVASRHAATTSKPKKAKLVGTSSSWDIPASPSLRSVTSRDIRCSGNSTSPPGASTTIASIVNPSSTSATVAPSTAKDTTSFIPEASLQDPTTDYWKIYQGQLDKKQRISMTELLRLHDWLAARPLMTNDIVSRSTLLIKELHRRRIRFNINLYNHLIHHHIKRTKYQDAQRVLDLMAEHRGSLRTDGPDGPMRQRTLALLLAMYLKSGNEAQLQALVNRDSSSSASSSEAGGDVLSQTMSEFLRWSKGLQLTNDQIERVKSIFHRVQDRNCSPNTPRFTSLIQRQFQDNRPGDAYRLMNHILDIGFHPNEYTTSSIMSGLLNARLYNEAIHIWDRVKDDPEARSDQVVLLNSLLSALCQDPTQFSTARELWGQILANPDIKPDAITFSNMLNGYFRAKDPSSAMALWEQMREKPFSIRPNSILYNAVMTGLFHNHRPKEAMKIFEQMVAQKDMVLPLDTFQIMIKGLLSVQDLENLSKVLGKMDEAGVEKDATTYTIITDTLFSQRDAEGAKQIVDLMTTRKVAKNAVTYSAIIAGLVNVGDFERARQLFSEMQEAGYKPTIHTFGAMMQGAFKAGDVELAESMAQLAMTTTKEGMSAGAYSIMISGYSSLLMMDKADHWFRELRHAILKACVEHRLWGPADRVLQAMEELGFKSAVPKLTKLIRRVEDVRAANPEHFPRPQAASTTTTTAAAATTIATTGE
ncbi:hypothetical protein BGX29_007806 [Mortierella sp. GBA35]|nr:hypothetical protein BGX29_007806 [Mortierella sp. GBA35]